MFEYIDLVLVICESGRRTILSAPFNSGLELNCSVDSEEYHFIKEYRGNDTFSKITGKISRFNYKGDSDV